MLLLTAALFCLVSSCHLYTPASAQFLFGSRSSSHTDSSKSFKSAILHEEQVGIHRFVLVGQMTAPIGLPLTVTAIGFLKFRRSSAPGMCTVRGMLIPHLPTEPQYTSEFGVRMNLKWVPRLQLRTKGAANVTLELTTDWAPFAIHQQDIPYASNGVDVAYTVHIDDWQQYSDVTPSVTMLLDSTPHKLPAGFWMVWGYTNYLQQNVAATQAYILFNHMQYHFKLGYSGYLVYIDATLLAPLLDSDPRIKQYMTEGKLRFVLWRGLPLWERWAYSWFDTTLTHAALLGWGSDIHMTFFDRDEALALPVGGSLQQLTQKCGKGSAMLLLEMTARYCESCTVNHTHGDVASFQNAVPRSGGAASQNFYYKYPDKCVATRANAKLIIHTSGILRANVHGGFCQRGLQDPVKIDRECGENIHMANLLVHRMSAKTFEDEWVCKMERDEKWTWPLD